MKFFILFFLCLLVAGRVQAGPGYRLNDKAIDQAFEQSEDVTQSVLVDMVDRVHSQRLLAEDNLQTIAAIIAFGEWILGVGVLIPIHRLILGAGGEEVKVVVLYCVTLGGCGLLPLLDGIFLLLDETGQRYIDNPKFLMWAGGND